MVFKSLLISVIFISYAIAAPNFTPTPLPPSVTNHLNPNINVYTSCPGGDCNDFHPGLPSSLPEPSAAALEPAAGSKHDFCNDVNIQAAPELCHEPVLLMAPTSYTVTPAAAPIKHKRKKATNSDS